MGCQQVFPKLSFPCLFPAVNLWRIYKAVEKLGGYDSVSTHAYIIALHFFCLKPRALEFFTTPPSDPKLCFSAPRTAQTKGESALTVVEER